MGNIEYNDRIDANVKSVFEAVQWAIADLHRVIPDGFKAEATREKSYIDSYVTTLGRFDFELQTVITQATPTEISYLAEWGSNEFYDDETGITALPPTFVKYYQDKCVSQTTNSEEFQS